MDPSAFIALHVHHDNQFSATICIVKYQLVSKMAKVNIYILITCRQNKLK